LLYASVSNDLGGGDAGKKGTHGYTLHYEVPSGYWLLGATASAYDFRQSVAGASQTYLYSGTSRNEEVRIARIVHRDAGSKTGAYARGWSRASSNAIDDTEIEVQRRRMSGWELGLTHRRFLAAATVDASVAYRRGTGAFHALAAPEEAFGEGTSRPRLITADAQLDAPFEFAGQRLRYTAAWRAQWARTRLVPQDRFAIGGRYTVRGFDGEFSLSAENGWLVRNELAWALGAYGTELYAGIDDGHVSGASSRLLLGTRLAGAVLGVRASYKGLALDLFAGAPLHKPDGFRTAAITSGFSLGYAF
jgi:hemolysin activation/secretion protein